MLLSAQKIRYEPIRSIGYAALIATGTTFAGVGSGYLNPNSMFKVWNLTDADIDISFDGQTWQDIVPAASGQIYDYGSNMTAQAGNLKQSLGTRVYMRVNSQSTAPTKKSVYITLIYASEA